MGEGELEDSRPRRLANAIGFAFPAAAALAWRLGSPAAGTALAAISALALLAAASGFCAGCEVCRLSARLRGASPRHHSRIDPAGHVAVDVDVDVDRVGADAQPADANSKRKLG